MAEKHNKVLVTMAQLKENREKTKARMRFLFPQQPEEKLFYHYLDEQEQFVWTTDSVIQNLFEENNLLHSNLCELTTATDAEGNRLIVIGKKTNNTETLKNEYLRQLRSEYLIFIKSLFCLGGEDYSELEDIFNMLYDEHIAKTDFLITPASEKLTEEQFERLSNYIVIYNE